MGLGAHPVVRRAALALAALAAVACPPPGVRTGTPRTAALVDRDLIAQLASPYASERARAAFRLGQLGVAWDPTPVELQVEADARLADRLLEERDPTVRVELVAALGRVGRARGRRALLAELERPGEARARAGWALSHLYRRLRDHDLDPASDVPALARALVAPEAEVRAGVVEALAEAKRPAARPLLLRELGDADATARARAARGLVGLAVPDDVPLLAETIARDDDERVRAPLALALGELVERGTAPSLAMERLLQLVETPLATPAVVVALAERGFIDARIAPLFAALDDRLRRIDGKARVACLAALGHDRALGRLERVPRCAVDAPLRARLAARALAEADPKRVPAAALLAQPADDHAVRAILIGALGRYDDAATAQRLVAEAGDADLPIRAAAAEAASLRRLAAAGPPLAAGLVALAARAGQLHSDEVDPLLSIFAAVGALKALGAAGSLRHFLEGTPAAVAVAARDALVQLGEHAVARPAPPRGRFDDDPLPAGPIVVRLQTARGPIRIEVRGDEAPRAARNFVGLVRQGFYDGLTFHRIVPGFVAQGGDPRGDGSGGAGHLVACEPSPAQYVEGTVGMALSGPDTGSSQFFIALAPAPHLEGRYTAFGRIAPGLGMAIARALEPGDKIEHATVEGAAP